MLKNIVIPAGGCAGAFARAGICFVVYRAALTY